MFASLVSGRSAPEVQALGGHSPGGLLRDSRHAAAGARLELGGLWVQERSPSRWWSHVRCAGRWAGAGRFPPQPSPRTPQCHGPRCIQTPGTSAVPGHAPESPGPQPHAGVLGSRSDTQRVKKPLDRPEAMQGLCVDNQAVSREGHRLQLRWVKPAVLARLGREGIGQWCSGPVLTPQSAWRCVWGGWATRDSLAAADPWRAQQNHNLGGCQAPTGCPRTPGV